MSVAQRAAEIAARLDAARDTVITISGADLLVDEGDRDAVLVWRIVGGFAERYARGIDNAARRLAAETDKERAA